MKFGEKIKELRVEKGLSQRALAKAVDISQKAIDNWELGVSEPKAGNIKRLADYFGVTTDYLLSDEDY